jgi:transposase-like protein
MKNLPIRMPRRRRRTFPQQRTAWLAAFERSGLSAAAFARQQGLPYTTFCAWRHRQARTHPTPAFVEVEVLQPSASAGLVIELGAQARLRLTSAAQMELAVAFVHRLNALSPC